MSQESLRTEEDFLEFRLFAEPSLICVMDSNDPGELEIQGTRPIRVKFEYSDELENSNSEYLLVRAMTTRRAREERLHTFRDSLSSEDAQRDGPGRPLNPSPMIHAPRVRLNSSAQLRRT